MAVPTLESNIRRASSLACIFTVAFFARGVTDEDINGGFNVSALPMGVYLQRIKLPMERKRSPLKSEAACLGQSLCYSAPLNENRAAFFMRALHAMMMP